MIPQTTLPFEYEIENKTNSLTAFAGLPLYSDLAKVSGLTSAISDDMKLCKSKLGWNDLSIIMSLVNLNLAGGDSISDVNRLNDDLGFRKLMLKINHPGLSRKERRKLLRVAGKKEDDARALPSESVIHRYLDNFHDAKQEDYRIANKAFIPKQNASLQKLIGLNQKIACFMQEKKPQKVATLEQDATISSTYKDSSLYCYKGYKSYQPLNTYWNEQGILLHSEFRDGNVPAGFEQLRVLKEALEFLPSSVEKVYLRSDTAAYQQELLQYLAKGGNERFGKIEFAIGVSVVKSFKEAIAEIKEEDWHDIVNPESGNKQQWAEVCFVPNWVASSNKNPEYRYIAIREPMAGQLSFQELETEETKNLPFPSMCINSARHKVFGIVTNRNIKGDELINWYRARCGRSEQVHSVQKTDLAGDRFPSAKFGANAAWWHIMVLAYNLNAIMQHLVLKGSFKYARMKKMRFSLINLVGRVVTHSRKLVIKLCDSASSKLLLKAREAILQLVDQPAVLNTS